MEKMFLQKYMRTAFFITSLLLFNRFLFNFERIKDILFLKENQRLFDIYKIGKITKYAM